MASDRGRGIAVKYRIALALVATSCMAGMAFAADLPVSGPYGSAPYIVRQPVEWTGFYFGANAGYGSGRYSSDLTFTGLNAGGNTTPFGLGPTELSGTDVIDSGKPRGAIAGGQIGFNWQAGMFVFGGEIDGQWSGQENTFTTSCDAGCTATQSIKIRSIWTGRGRVGLAFDWFMPYVTGGAALVDGLNNLTMTVGGTTASFAPLSHSTLGWTAGAGVEVALWRNWSAKLEYLFVGANGATKFAPIPNALGLGSVSTPGDYRDNIVRVGFNYRFGPLGGPGLLEFAPSGARRVCVELRFSAESAVCDGAGERAGRRSRPSKKSGSSSDQAGRHAGCRSAARPGGKRSGTGGEASRPAAGSSTASRLRHKRAAVLDGR